MIPRIGDDIYLDTELYLSHGSDDFEGGLCEVINVKEETIAGRLIVFVEIKENPGSYYNWDYLRAIQDGLRERFGTQRGRPIPDDRPEFNEDAW
jgi:hypothetical protein